MFDLQVRPVLKPFAIAIFFGILPSILVGVFAVFSKHISNSIYLGSLNALGMLIALIILLKTFKMMHLLKDWFKLNWKYSLIGLAIGLLSCIIRWKIITKTISISLNGDIMLINTLMHNNFYISVFILIMPPVLFYPVFEEVCFRGMVQSAFSSIYKNYWISIILTSGLFALLHLTSALDWLDIVYIFILAIILSIIKNRSLSLWPPIILHSAYNSLELILKLKALH